MYGLDAGYIFGMNGYNTGVNENDMRTGTKKKKKKNPCPVSFFINFKTSYLSLSDQSMRIHECVDKRKGRGPEEN